MEDFLDLAHLRVIEHVVLPIPQADRPVVASIHRALVDNHGDQSVLLASEVLHLLVLDWITVFHLLMLEGLKSVEVEDEYGGESLHMQLLLGERHGVTLRAVPSILFIQQLRLCK